LPLTRRAAAILLGGGGKKGLAGEKAGTAQGTVGSCNSSGNRRAERRTVPILSAGAQQTGLQEFIVGLPATNKASVLQCLQVQQELTNWL
jgi:hypothetical protein